MKPIKQIHTDIVFSEFKEQFPEEELIAYQAHIRFLTLLDYKFFELRKPDGYYICTTTGMWKLDKKSKLFGRVNEINKDLPIEEEKLTYYEISKAKKNRIAIANGEAVPQRRRFHNQDGTISSRIAPEIILDVRTSSETLQALALKHGISKSTAYNIRIGKIYSDILDK